VRPVPAAGRQVRVPAERQELSRQLRRHLKFSAPTEIAAKLGWRGRASAGTIRAMNRLAWLAGSALILAGVACGARSGLRENPQQRGAGGTGGGADGGGGQGPGGQGGTGGIGGNGGNGGTGGTICEVEGQPCTTNLPGPCAPGFLHCVGDTVQCLPKQGPQPEQCNLIDDNCNGMVDDGDPGGGGMCNTGLPSSCAAGTLHCQMGKIVCVQNNQPQLEVCNGIDDNCNNVVDQDCEKGDCKPSLLVLGSTPSNPNCQDFPIVKGSTGTIQYPCAGGMVMANLNGIVMTGSVMNGVVSLIGTNKVVGPDKCTWELTHTIKGTLSSGIVTYNYSEKISGGTNCWQPCTEVGTVQVKWTN
jgi:hypothetical protein